MKTLQGSAIFMVIIFIAVISSLLLAVQYRCSLLLETVDAREKQLQLLYARQALMLYALIIVKYNWYYINDVIKKTGIASYTDFLWPVTPEKRIKSNIYYTAALSGIHIKIELQRCKALSCVMKMNAESDDYNVSEWYENT